MLKRKSSFRLLAHVLLSIVLNLGSNYAHPGHEGVDADVEEFISDIEYYRKQIDLNDDLMVGTSTTESPRIVRTSIGLSADRLPQFVFTLHSNASEFEFYLSSEKSIRDQYQRYGYDEDDEVEYIYRSNSFNYKLNVVVEKMTCYETPGRNIPSLVFKGYNKDQIMTFCSKFDNTINSFQTVQHLLDDVRNLTVRADGDWTDLSATLVASIYYEVTESCDNCADGYFCCGSRGSCAIPSTMKFHPHHKKNDDRTRRYRCIPRTSLSMPNRQNDLICNRHPNCGFYCNVDESMSICMGYDDNVHCIGSDCHLGDVAIRIAILILFCFLLPPLLIIIACRFKFAREACDKLNQRVANRLRGRERGSESTIGSVDEFSDNEPGSRVIVSTITPTPRPYNPADDPPPSYEDSLKVPKIYSEPPPPSFEETLILPVQVSNTNNNRNGNTLRQMDATPTTIPIVCDINVQEQEQIVDETLAVAKCKPPRSSEEEICEAVNPQIVQIHIDDQSPGVGTGGFRNHAFDEDEDPDNFNINNTTTMT